VPRGRGFSERASSGREPRGKWLSGRGLPQVLAISHEDAAEFTELTPHVRTHHVRNARWRLAVPHLPSALRRTRKRHSTMAPTHSVRFRHSAVD
jgi:hypothetical protein